MKKIRPPLKLSCAGCRKILAYGRADDEIGLTPFEEDNTAIWQKILADGVREFSRRSNRAAVVLLSWLTAIAFSSCAALNDTGQPGRPDYPAARSAAASEPLDEPGTESGSETSAAPANSWSAEYFLSQCGEPISDAYRALYEGIFDHREDIKLPLRSVTQKDFGDLLSLVNSTGLCGDYISPDYKMYVDGDGFVERAAVEYILTANEVSSRYSLLTAEAARLAEKAALLPDDYERVKFYHDELVRSCEYSSEGSDSHSAYGALCAKKAVCEGYAKAFLLLCELSDIPCLPVGGSAVDKDGVQQLHMWNKVRLDGKWYNVDCTWDDPMGVEPGSVRYDHFLMSDKDISVTHTEDAGGLMRLPEADDGAGSYFDREGLLLTGSDDIEARFREQCELCIEGALPDDTVRFKCDSKGMYAQVTETLFSAPPDSDNGMVTILQEFLTDDRGLSYVLTTDENMLTINLHIIVQAPEAYDEAYG